MYFLLDYITSKLKTESQQKLDGLLEYWPPIVENQNKDTYPMPKDGWVCFHCGERFTVPGKARAHFGATPDLKPACLIKGGDGDLFLLDVIRKQESVIKQLERKIRLKDVGFETIKTIEGMK